MKKLSNYYDNLVDKVKGLKQAREKYLDDFSKIEPLYIRKSQAEEGR